MARTWRSAPDRVRERRGQPNHLRHLRRDSDGAQQSYVKENEGAARARCRDALLAGAEPEPYRTRSSAKWEAG